MTVIIKTGESEAGLVKFFCDNCGCYFMTDEFSIEKGFYITYCPECFGITKKFVLPS